MTEPAPDIALNRKLASDLFNLVWTLLDKPDRNAEENEQLIHAAHASRYHWSVAGTAKEWSVGDWQISRVYSVLNRPEPALHHARRAMELARAGGLGPFFVAYAHEAIARAYTLYRDNENARLQLALAREAADSIPEAENRKMLEDDLATIHLK